MENRTTPTPSPGNSASRDGRRAGFEVALLRRLSTALAALGVLFWLVMGVGWFRGVRTVPVLRDAGSTRRRGGCPSVSVVVPVRDEERSVGEGLGSVLAQDYPGNLEVIAVDDRSTDGTTTILKGLERDHPGRLRVIRVEELPEDWLGKNHALHAGAAEARGEWLLLTDADVRLSPTCLSRAVDYAISNGLDHLTLPPEIVARGALLKGFVVASGSSSRSPSGRGGRRTPGRRRRWASGRSTSCERASTSRSGPTAP